MLVHSTHTYYVHNRVTKNCVGRYFGEAKCVYLCNEELNVFMTQKSAENLRSGGAVLRNLSVANRSIIQAQSATVLPGV